MLRRKNIYSWIVLVIMIVFLNGFFGNNAFGSGVEIPTSGETGLSDSGIDDILANILRWMLGVVGIVALIGFVISGLQYILSAGDEKMAETGKRNMTYSIIGVIVVLGAFVIVQAIDQMLNANSF